LSCPTDRSAVTRHLAAWLVLMLIAVANGLLREFSYGRQLPELAAHQLSTASGMLLTGLCAWLLARRWPLPDAAATWRVGATWLALTIGFEFGFGHFVAGHGWDRLWHDYDLSAGRLWLVFLAWVLVMPYIFHRRRP